ncbi:hypothetical protein F5Y17DRAFT_73299 [Xylariaceae sp. FL0594]|nr:hypothetical protein F5Y17DRAFT_73299 [Xylariaceae sp. FL0594]
MLMPSALLSLPPSLLLLLATQLYALPDSSIASFKQHGGETGERSPEQLLPTAVRKMSLDEGEMFMPEYYAFAPGALQQQLERGSGHLQSPPPSQPHLMLAREADAPVLTPVEEALLAANNSATLAFRPPFPLHLGYRDSADLRGSSIHRAREKDGGRSRSGGDDESTESFYRRARSALARLQGRGFTCPGGTHACSDIGRPNYCCPDGATCSIVDGAPNAGNVGCCPEGQTCGGSVAPCPAGNTACSAEQGGGCCIPGFTCAEVGCVQSSTTVVAPPTTMTSTTTTSTTFSTSETPTSTPTPTSASDSGTGTGLPPVRPTSSNPSPTTSTTPAAPPYCPTGFYACLASPAPATGCCRIGRDCSSTSCPPAAPMTTIVSDHGVTIAVPVETATTATTRCADGWFSCGGGGGGGGCCPSGYACGSESCTLAAPTATETVAKEAPSSSSSARLVAVAVSAVMGCWAVVVFFVLV